MAWDARIKTYLSKVEYPKEILGNPQHDFGCKNWGGLLEFSVKENGSYIASVPFEGLLLGFGETKNPNIFVYDGLGGYCGLGTPAAALEFRVTVGGIDSTGQSALGWIFDPNQSHPGTRRPHPRPTEYKVVIDVETQMPKRNAKLWFYFSVGTMC